MHKIYCRICLTLMPEQFFFVCGHIHFVHRLEQNGVPQLIHSFLKHDWGFDK